MSTTIQSTSANDLLQMPDDGFRYELVRGELTKMSPAGNKHGRFAANITGSLVPHVKANKLGAVYAAETGFWLASEPDTVRAPDVAFVSQKQLDEVGDVDGFWPGAPDLVVEVISPSDAYTEVEEKVFEWLGAGTRIVVLVSPSKRATYRSLTDIRILTEDDTLDGGDVVPGWTMSVKEIFA
ncbi:MAG TPA: Uma2 family endonuclease [Blastocatellia bacterium]|nr:Uma2 family endonuclease [Blastocatellia bacterium]